MLPTPKPCARAIVKTILVILAWLGTVIVLASLFPVPAHAGERVAREGSNQAVFSDEVCSYPKVLHYLDPRAAAQMHNAVVTFQGKTYQACYLEDDSAFMLQFEDGDIGMVAKRDLLPGT